MNASVSGLAPLRISLAVVFPVPSHNVCACLGAEKVWEQFKYSTSVCSKRNKHSFYPGRHVSAYFKSSTWPIFFVNVVQAWLSWSDDIPRWKILCRLCSFGHPLCAHSQHLPRDGPCHDRCWWWAAERDPETPVLRFLMQTESKTFRDTDGSLWPFAL